MTDTTEYVSVPKVDDVRERVMATVAACAADGIGFWRTCTGCFESEDGYPNGDYPCSPTFNCTLGAGCSDCGGIGAIWDTIDYSDMANFLHEAEAPPSLWKDIKDAPVKGRLRAFIRGGVYAAWRDVEFNRGWTPFLGATEAVRSEDGTWTDRRILPRTHLPTHYVLEGDLLALPIAGGK